MSNATHVRLAEGLARQLAEPGRGIAAWRLVVDAGTSTEVGLKDNHPGGPYDAPNAVSGSSRHAAVRGLNAPACCQSQCTRRSVRHTCAAKTTAQAGNGMTGASPVVRRHRNRPPTAS